MWESTALVLSNVLRFNTEYYFKVPIVYCITGIFHHILHRFLPYSRSLKKEKKTDGDVEKDRELNVGAVVRNIVIVDNQVGTKRDACTDKSEIVGLISNTEKQETETKPEADPEATRNEPITKIVVDGAQFVYNGKEVVGNEDQAGENGVESTIGNPTLELK